MGSEAVSVEFRADRALEFRADRGSRVQGGQCPKEPGLSQVQNLKGEERRLPTLRAGKRVL